MHDGAKITGTTEHGEPENAGTATDVNTVAYYAGRAPPRRITPVEPG